MSIGEIELEVLASRGAAVDVSATWDTYIDREGRVIVTRDVLGVHIGAGNERLVFGVDRVAE